MFRAVRRTLGLRCSRNFHSSCAPRWVTPQSLSTSELRRESERRELSPDGNRSTLLERIELKLTELGGHDNGLTLDSNLAADKREIESQMNRMPDNAYLKSQLAVDTRVQLKLSKSFVNDSRVTFHNNSAFVTIEGRYSEMRSLRSQISVMAAELASNETNYSLPHSVALRLKRTQLQQLRREHDVQFSMTRPQGTSADAVVLTVEGETLNRMAACDAIEAVMNKIRLTEHDVPGLESYSPRKQNRRRKVNALEQSLVVFPSSLSLTKNDAKKSDRVHDSEPSFDGVVLFVDSRIREFLHDYRSRIDTIASQTNTNIHVGCRDLFWLNDNQVGIEGGEKEVSAARREIDQLINQLKSLSMSIVVPPSINNEFAKESKSLADAIQKKLGVDTLVVEQNEHILVHLVGPPSEMSTAATMIDSCVYRLSRTSGAERAHADRRERVRNMNFQSMGIGGLDGSLRTMLRRTFESRLISPRLRKELGLSHVRGVLLRGAPGTGKTLIARKIAEILGCKEPKIVNGPEVESKWVGEAEKNIRELFEEASEEQKEKGDASDLHIVIFDEIDAIAKKRGGSHGKSRDGALNQLLCCMDGVDGLDNILVFGLTNRKDCLDPALLRPGRLEAQLEIGLPDAAGREEILKIHTRAMREHGRMADDVDLRLLAQYAEDFSGADIAGMIRSAISFALEDLEDEDEVVVDQGMLERGLHEVRMARDRLPTSGDDEVQEGHGHKDQGPPLSPGTKMDAAGQPVELMSAHLLVTLLQQVTWR